MPSRNPYAAVKRQLRREVGFQCPVRDCGNPYLTWHHFDPPWRIKQHHRPEGMIALCAEHANKADHGAFTDEQLRDLKRRPPAFDDVGGRFDWRRNEFLVRVGGNWSYQQLTIFQINDTPCVWLTRDDEELLTVSFRMPSISGEPRASMIDNFWSAPATADEIICPPMGRKIEVKYGNGDYFKIVFKNIEKPDYLGVLYPAANVARIASRVSFPVTLVELTSVVIGTSLQFTPSESRIGNNIMSENFSVGSGGAGIRVQIPDNELRRILPEADT